MRQQIEKLFERLERAGIATAPFRAGAERHSEVHAGNARIAAPVPAHEIEKLRGKLSRRGTPASEVERELVKVRAENGVRIAAKKKWVEDERAARVAFARPIREHLEKTKQRAGEEMGEIAQAHRDACLSAPALLPARIVELYRLALSIETFLSEEMLLSVPRERGSRLLPRTVFSYVDEDLRPGVRIRCGLPPHRAA